LEQVELVQRIIAITTPLAAAAVEDSSVVEVEELIVFHLRHTEVELVEVVHH
jgi:hypothetical protein